MKIITNYTKYYCFHLSFRSLKRDRSTSSGDDPFRKLEIASRLPCRHVHCPFFYDDDDDDRDDGRRISRPSFAMAKLYAETSILRFAPKRWLCVNALSRAKSSRMKCGLRFIFIFWRKIDFVFVFDCFVGRWYTCKKCVSSFLCNDRSVMLCESSFSVEIMLVRFNFVCELYRWF